MPFLARTTNFESTLRVNPLKSVACYACGVIELLQAAPAQSASTNEFYQTLSALSFTLLGLWTVVIELRLRAARTDIRERRHIYGVLLFFLLPGLMSLFAIIDDSATWWRLVFGITASIGLAEIVLYFQSNDATPSTRDLVLRGAGFVDYLLVILVALRPTIARDLDIGFTGIQVEAVLVTGLLVIGVHMVFFAIVERPEPDVT